jgi:hypothetical protein
MDSRAAMEIEIIMNGKAVIRRARAATSGMFELPYRRSQEISEVRYVEQ